MTLIYLATPYTNYPHGLESAYKKALAHGQFFALQGIPVFSPIVYCHHIASTEFLKKEDREFWLNFNKPFLHACTSLVVVKMESYATSKGIAWEIDYMRKLQKPIFYTEEFTIPSHLQATN